MRGCEVRVWEKGKREVRVWEEEEMERVGGRGECRKRKGWKE